MMLGGVLACALNTSVSADETHNRRAELVDFAYPPLLQHEVSQISSVMLIDFGGMVAASETRREPMSQTRTHLVPSSFPTERMRIPRWMQLGASADFAGVDASTIAPLGSCLPRPYLPSTILGRGPERRRQLLYPLVHHAACEARIPVALMDALLIQESRYNPLATSTKGAFGLGQLMPATARQLGVDRYNLQENLRGAARYLSQQLREFGRVDLALAAYNAGPARVRAAKGVPRIAETINYVHVVLTNWNTIEAKHAALRARLLPQQPTRSIWRGNFRTDLHPTLTLTDD